MDPVQARLSQLGSMQARTLEEIELQQPLFERTLRPMAHRLSGIAQRFASPTKVSRTEKRLLMAGNPGDLRSIDFLGMKLVIAGLVGVLVFVIFGVLSRLTRVRLPGRHRARRPWASWLPRCGSAGASRSARS